MGSDTFESLLGQGVALGAAPVLKFTETYNQFDDAKRYAASLQLLFDATIEIQFHDIFQTIHEFAGVLLSSRPAYS